MKATILHILCEGQTEERFVKGVLSPYLSSFNIFAKPVILLTSKKKNARGGMISYNQAKRDIELLSKRFNNNDYERHVITSMFDYYALPDDFPCFNEARGIPGVRERVEFLEKKFGEDIKIDSFIPYIQLHEFEALLFTDITKLKDLYPFASDAINRLKIETDRYEDPEMIDDGPETAPSKRIIKALKDKYHYNKVFSGEKVTSIIGVESLLNRCMHFREWVEAIVSSGD